MRDHKVETGKVLVAPDPVNAQELTAASVQSKQPDILPKRRLLLIIVLAGILLILEVAGYGLSFYKQKAYVKNTGNDIEKRMSLKRLQAANFQLKKRLSNISLQGTYLVIDTAVNRLYLRNGQDIIKEAVVSTGSGGMLNDPDGDRKWVFDTPRGVLTVRGKKTAPVWTKPDWAFIEEGKPVPKDFKGRIEKDVLGDYALELGDGYLIHGTLYTRLLGRNVTHGCVRVGDEDLKLLYETVPVGTKVVIF
ncbi:L,D-transpeptidase [bacterium]|nr:L,D-transpeptidase [bacterium]MBU1614657.1 L,D-transpeptidase [bacterium]